MITIQNSVEKKNNLWKKLFVSPYGLLLCIYLNVCFWHGLFDTYITCNFNVISATKCKGGNDNISSNKPLNDESLRKPKNIKYIIFSEEQLHKVKVPCLIPVFHAIEVQDQVSLNFIILSHSKHLEGKHWSKISIGTKSYNLWSNPLRFCSCGMRLCKTFHMLNTQKLPSSPCKESATVENINAKSISLIISFKK